MNRTNFRRRRRPNRKPRPPIAKMVGILTACSVALSGIYLGLAPFVILCRAMIAACVMSGFVVLAIYMFDATNTVTEKT